MPKKAEAAGNSPSMTKTDAAKAAIAAGKDMPTEGVQWIKETHGIDIDPQHFSAIKSQARKKAGGPPARRGRKPRTTPSGSGAGSGRAPVSPADLARDVKRLVEQYGAAAVKDMAGVFAD
jgi:hypothetical protein